MRRAGLLLFAVAAALVAFLAVPEGGPSLVVFELALVASLGAVVARVARFDDVESPPRPRLPWGRRVPASRRIPPSLRRVERLLVYGLRDRHSAETRLLPMLRTLTAHHLAHRHGIDLAADPAAARARLGDRVWALLELRPAADEHRPLPTRDDIAAIVTAIERL